MQERYCKCGNRVIVQYCNRRSDNWMIRYWQMGNNYGKTIRICPHCGRRIDIDSLC